MDLKLTFAGLFGGSSCCLEGSKTSFSEVGLPLHLSGWKEEEAEVQERRRSYEKWAQHRDHRKEGRQHNFSAFTGELMLLTFLVLGLKSCLPRPWMERKWSGGKTCSEGLPGFLPGDRFHRPRKIPDSHVCLTVFLVQLFPFYCPSGASSVRKFFSLFVETWGHLRMFEQFLMDLRWLGGCISFLGFPGGSVVKNLPPVHGGTGLTPGWEDSLE